MNRTTLSIICIFAVLAIVVAGEMYAYIPDDRGFSSEASRDGSTVSYSLSAEGAFTYRSTLFDNADMTPVSKVYIYRDKGYASYVDDGRVIAVGAQAMTQDYYIDQLTKNLKMMGTDDITVLNAAELKDTLSSDLAGTAKGKGLIIAAGSAPDTVFGDSDILKDWISAGGYLYWAAGPIGRFMATPGGLVQKDLTADLIGTDDILEDESRCLGETELRPLLYYNYMYSRFAPDMDKIAGRAVLGAGYSDGEGHCTVTAIQNGAGQIVIFGGDYNYDQLHDMAITLSSGICCKTAVLDTREREFNRDASGTFETSSAGNLSVYISIGQYYGVYADRFDL